MSSCSGDKMTVEMHGFDLDIRATGIIHSTGEQVVFTIEEATNSADLATWKPPLLFFTPLKYPQPEGTHDHLYFCAKGGVQRITFLWGSDPSKRASVHGSIPELHLSTVITPITWGCTLTLRCQVI